MAEEHPINEVDICYCAGFTMQSRGVGLGAGGLWLHMEGWVVGGEWEGGGGWKGRG